MQRNVVIFLVVGLIVGSVAGYAIGLFSLQAELSGMSSRLTNIEVSNKRLQSELDNVKSNAASLQQTLDELKVNRLSIYGFSFLYPEGSQTRVAGIGAAGLASKKEGQILCVPELGGSVLSVYWISPATLDEDNMKSTIDNVLFGISIQGGVSNFTRTEENSITVLQNTTAFLVKFRYSQDIGQGSVNWFGTSAAWIDLKTGRIFNLALITTKEDSSLFKDTLDNFKIF